MRLSDDPKTATWLSNLNGDSASFDWDDGNRGKCRKHRVDDREIESLFAHPYLFAGRIVEPAHDERRWLVLGEDDGGRRLALIFTRRNDRLRPISCRPMRKEERAVYEKAIQADD
jgi:uncharacterized DUF497 family protein